MSTSAAKIVRNRPPMRRQVQRVILHAVVIVLCSISVFPFLWMVLSSFKYNQDVLSIPLRFIPPRWNWGSYASAFTYADYNFARYFYNSTVVTVFAVLLCIVLSTTAGYGFAKFRFRGREALFLLILSTLMIPFQAIIVPLFVLVRTLGWQNRYIGLIVPEALTAFGVFMMRQFFYSVPDDMIESARIDGANEYQTFFHVAVPISRTAILALVIFHAQWVWNLLLWPLVIISRPAMRTLPQGIALFAGVYFTPYPEQLAISVVASLPLLTLYIFLSKYFIQGIAMTGLKG
jgi:ABC-type glycerol-3-phosphate transport system permease component